MMRGGAVSAAVFLLSMLLASTAFADWPMARHDAQRTGAATGVSNITSPVPYWRAYMGGSAGPRSLMGIDVDGDGSAELVVVSGDRMLAYKPDGTLAWKTPLLGLTQLVAYADLDGDGRKDIVARSLDHVYVIAAKTGVVEWAEPTGEMGTIGDVRVADFNGDNLDDLLIQECGCCAVISGKTGFAYSFAKGFGNPTLLWTLPSIVCGGHRAMAVVDVDGSGSEDVTLASYTNLSIVSGATGQVIATSPGGLRMDAARCTAADIDGVPGQELICLIDVASAGGAGHQVVAFHYTSSQSPHLEVVWQQNIGEEDNRLAWGPGVVSDLDGDGQLEVVVGGTVTSGDQQTYVLDARTGTTLTSVPGQISGVVPRVPPERDLVLTEKGTVLSGWTFSRSSSAMSLQWNVPDVRPLVEPDWRAAAASALADQFVMADCNGDGREDLVFAGTGSSSGKLLAYDPSALAAPVASYSFPGEGQLQQAWTVPPSTRPYPQLVAASSGGALIVFDDKLSRTNLPGPRIGGFYASGARDDLDVPVVGTLEQGAPEMIVATKSSGELQALDAKLGTFAVPPVAKWEEPESTTPTIISGLDKGSPGIVCKTEPTTTPPEYNVTALRAEGTKLWSVGVPADPFGDLLPARLDGDSTPDVVFMWGAATNTVINVRGISGVNGSTLWNAMPVNPGPNRSPSGGAVYDWNNDGSDDFIYQFYQTRIVSGRDGSVLAQNAQTIPYAMPTVYDVDGDGVPEITLHGSLSAARTIGHDLSTTLWKGPDDRPFPYGAIARCPGAAPRLVEGSSDYPSRLAVTELSGATAGSRLTIVLAGGHMYSDEAAATQAGAMLGTLSSVSVHTDLTGKNRPTAVVGSSDGWLYGVNPCDDSLDFAYNFGAPVGAVAFGDTNGDGLDEILASVDNGYLYDLQESPISPVKWVWDVDPATGRTNADIDVTPLTGKLSGKWASASGADSYEVAIAKADGSAYVTNPPWQDVGKVTQATISGLALAIGQQYRFAVRAVKAGRVSPDVVSDGVTILPALVDGGTADTGGAADAGPPDGAADASVSPALVSAGGCNCTEGPGAGDSFWWLVAVMLSGVAAWRGGRREREIS